MSSGLTEHFFRWMWMDGCEWMDVNGWMDVDGWMWMMDVDGWMDCLMTLQPWGY